MSVEEMIDEVEIEENSQEVDENNEDDFGIDEEEQEEE